jgi:hypothetical protein
MVAATAGKFVRRVKSYIYITKRPPIVIVYPVLISLLDVRRLILLPFVVRDRVILEWMGI